MAFIKKRRPWTSQPQEAVDLSTSGLGAGIFASIDGQNAHVNSAPTAAGTGSTLPPIVATPKGIGSNTAGGIYDRRLLVDGPIAATAPWTIACTLQPFGNQSLSHLFGFGLNFAAGELDSSVGNDGKYRGLLNFNNHYYFWGSNADWDTGISFDTDGAVHTVMVSHDGTTLYFYRDGVLRASSTRPAGMVSSNTNRYVVLGNEHDAGTASPNARLISGRAWNRFLSAAEAKDYADNPNLVYEPKAIMVPVSAGGGGTTVNGALGTATASGFTGNVNANRTIAGALGTAMASGFQGTVSNSTDTTINGNLGTAVASGLQGNVNANRTIAGGLGTAAASGFQGTVSNSNDVVIGGSLGVAIASGLLGNVNANRTISGNLGTAVASGFQGTVSNGSTTDLALILKILRNRQELNAATGKFTLYDDDGTTVLYESDAWEDTAGTIPYRGRALRRIDALT